MIWNKSLKTILRISTVAISGIQGIFKFFLFVIFYNGHVLSKQKKIREIYF